MLRLLRRFSTASAQPLRDARVLLESSIASRESSRALACLDVLQERAEPPEPQLLQRLALLIAKRGAPHEAPRAAEILRGLLSEPQFAADDHTQLATIYTIDACLRNRRLEDALQLFQAARERELIIDLPAVGALLQALVDAHRVDEAVGILRIVTTQHDVTPSEQTFAPVLFAVMQQQRYEDVVALLEHGRANGVNFSPETYDPLVELSQEQFTAANEDRLGKFMEYVNDALTADGYWDEDDEDDDEDEDGDFFDDDDDDSFDEDDEFD